MARPPLSTEQRARADARARARILQGLADGINAQGYAATTVADIAARAHVSKSTVYTHFKDRDDILFALFASLTDALLEAIERAEGEAKAAGQDWRERVASGTRAYIETMLSGGELTRCAILEVPTIPRGLHARREVMQRYGRLLDRLVADMDVAGTEGLRVPAPLMVGALGGMHELLLWALEQDEDVRDVDEVVAQATGLLIGLLEAAVAAARTTGA